MSYMYFHFVLCFRALSFAPAGHSRTLCQLPLQVTLEQVVACTRLSSFCWLWNCLSSWRFTICLRWIAYQLRCLCGGGECNSPVSFCYKAAVYKKHNYSFYFATALDVSLNVNAEKIMASWICCCMLWGLMVRLIPSFLVDFAPCRNTWIALQLWQKKAVLCILLVQCRDFSLCGQLALLCLRSLLHCVFNSPTSATMQRNLSLLMTLPHILISSLCNVPEADRERERGGARKRGRKKQRERESVWRAMWKSFLLSGKPLWIGWKFGKKMTPSLDSRLTLYNFHPPLPQDT